MRINNNIMAMNANRQLGINNTGVAKSLEKLSSGFRVNRAGDDAAGLAISEKMRAQVRGLNMASKNAQDGISLIQTAEGALDEVHSILQRMRELAVQSANDTNISHVDREAMQDELNQLLEEIDKISERTEFNTQKLLDGTFTNKKFHVGANKDQEMEVEIGNLSTGSEGLNIESLKIDGNSYITSGSIASGNAVYASGGILRQEDANKAIETINNAINEVSTQRSKLGAYQNRLEHTIKNLDNAAENLQAAESRIRDVDMAKEMMEFTKQTILQQAATAMLAQSNSVPQTVLQLLR